jgi:hypothetical protein
LDRRNPVTANVFSTSFHKPRGFEAAKPFGCSDQKYRVEVFQKELILEHVATRRQSAAICDTPAGYTRESGQLV